MEDDEHGDVAPDVVSSGPNESVAETTIGKMDVEGEIEGSHDEGDGGEIMVEIVGSDVFVDGVGGVEESNLGVHVRVDETGNLDFREAVGEGVRDKEVVLEKSEVLVTEEGVIGDGRDSSSSVFAEVSDQPVGDAAQEGVKTVNEEELHQTVNVVTSSGTESIATQEETNVADGVEAAVVDDSVKPSSEVSARVEEAVLVSCSTVADAEDDPIGPDNSIVNDRLEDPVIRANMKDEINGPDTQEATNGAATIEGLENPNLEVPDRVNEVVLVSSSIKPAVVDAPIGPDDSVLSDKLEDQDFRENCRDESIECDIQEATDVAANIELDAIEVSEKPYPEVPDHVEEVGLASAAVENTPIGPHDVNEDLKDQVVTAESTDKSSKGDTQEAIDGTADCEVATFSVSVNPVPDIPAHVEEVGLVSSGTELADENVPMDEDDSLVDIKVEDHVIRINSGDGSNSGIDSKVVDHEKVSVSEGKDLTSKSDVADDVVKDDLGGSEELKRHETVEGVDLEPIHAQSFGGEGGEVTGMNIDGVVDNHGEVSGVNISDTSHSSNFAQLNHDDATHGNDSAVLADSDMHAGQPSFPPEGSEKMNDENVANADVADFDVQKGENEIITKDSQTASDETIQSSERGEYSEDGTGHVTVAENGGAGNDPILLNEVPIDDTESKGIQNKEQEIAVQVTEKPSDEVVQAEATISRPNEVDETAAEEDVSPGGGDQVGESHVSDVATSTHEVNQSEDKSSKINGDYILHDHTPDEQKHEEEQSDSEEPGTEEHASGIGQLKASKSKNMKQPGYLLPPEHEGQFSVSDLVWGKVRSHPWWPGQIFDPSDASEKASKYYKKDSFLVAYFGDRTFAWNDASVIKPFRSHFSQIEKKQRNSETFQNAVSCALEEVSRRVELALSCSCTPKDAYDKIKTQIIENTGIKEESSRRSGVDQSSRAELFEPDNLLEYVKELAPLASYGADRLDLSIAQAQLVAFYRYQGYRLPNEIFCSGDLENDAGSPKEVNDAVLSSKKRKHTPKESLPPKKKEKTMTELVGSDMVYSPDGEDEPNFKDPSIKSSGKKRRAADSFVDDSNKRESIVTVESKAMSPKPKPSFKIGECIRRVASQLTGSASAVKNHTDQVGVDGSPKAGQQSPREGKVAYSESSSPDEMLSLLQLMAQDPGSGHTLLNPIGTFFSGFRSSIASHKRARKKKAASQANAGSTTEEFEFDDVNDSYWTDRIVHKNSEEEMREENNQLVPYDPERPVKQTRKPYSRKKSSSGNHVVAAPAEDSSELVERKRRESSPAELILNFAERDSLPSEINLNKMFRRFGPLMESETEVDRESGRAKVIFKKGCDAEVAYNSAGKFDIFGPVLVNYQLNYSPVIPVKISPLVIQLGHDEAT